MSNNISKKPKLHIGETAKINQLIKQGVQVNIPLTFGNYNQLYSEIFHIRKLDKGYDMLMERFRKVTKKSYSIFMDKDTNASQRERMLFDIVRYEMIPHIIIKQYGNSSDVPLELRTWEPIFGWDTFRRALPEVSSSDITNIWWSTEADRLYEVELLKQIKPKVEEVELQIIDADTLWFGHNNLFHNRKFEDLPDFWDKKTKRPNTYANILVDLSNSVYKELSENGDHKQFGKGNQANKQLSIVCQRLEKIIPIESNRKGINRWFREIEGTHKTWKPRFKLIQNRTPEQNQWLEQIINEPHREKSKVDINALGMSDESAYERQKRDYYEAQGIGLYDERETKTDFLD